MSSELNYRILLSGNFLKVLALTALLYNRLRILNAQMELLATHSSSRSLYELIVIAVRGKNPYLKNTKCVIEVFSKCFMNECLLLLELA